MKSHVDRTGSGKPSAADRELSGAGAPRNRPRGNTSEPSAKVVERAGGDEGSVKLDGADASPVKLDGADASRVKLDGTDASRVKLDGTDASSMQTDGIDAASIEPDGIDASSAIADATAKIGDRAVADEERRAPREAYPALLARLSRQSVTKRYEAFRDIDWEAPDFAVRADDLRWELGPDDPLGGTAWYRAQPPAERARIGLYRVATFMKVGVQFENVLSRGLLSFILTRSERSPEHRYAYHELIEESHHSMMFSEFVRRTGFDVGGLTPRLAWLGTRVAGLAARFPELFFVFVLGGEDPIDHAQRLALSGTQAIHPLLRRISQIHITEEADRKSVV